MILEMHDIVKEYTLGRTVSRVLNHVDLRVEEGEYLAIMGPSGSGKTTLLNLIGCLDVPTSGSYVFAGRDVTKLSQTQLADLRNRELGFVFQSFYLLANMNAIENVALPLLYQGVHKKERMERAAEALRTVGLEDRMKYRPDQLSGGQSQRVAIARAIATKPRLLLADEPPGALDSQSGAQVMDLFEMLHKAGSSIVMITHDPNVARRADRIRTIRDGVLSDTEEAVKDE